MTLSSNTIAFGDSNTANANWETMGYDEAKKWVNKMALLRPMINSGVAGNTTVHGRNRFQVDILDKKPKTVLIMFGTNDMTLRTDGTPKTPKDIFNTDLRSFVDKLRAIGSKPVLMTAIPLIEEGTGFFYSRHPRELYAQYGGAREWLEQYNDITRTIARQKAVPLVDNYRMFIQYSGGLETDEAFVNSNLFDASGTHMSEYGAEILYRTVKTTLANNVGY